MDDDNKGLSIVEIAKKRYDLAKDYYAQSRELSRDDNDFVYGDPENGNQYPYHMRQDRNLFERQGNLTVNITNQTCKKIINNVRMNRPQGKVIPADSSANKEAAEVIAKWCRSVQSYSNADDASDHAFECMVHGGEGYWEISLDYEAEDSFSMIPYICLIDDPCSVYIDPSAKKLDRSDAEWGFIEEEISKDRARREHPGVELTDWETDNKWVKENTVVRCKYYYCDYVTDTLEQYDDGKIAFKSLNYNGLVVNSRKTWRKEWWVCTLLGGAEKPVEKRLWPGNYLPIVSVYGNEYKAGGQTFFSGEVRALKDVNRIVNYAFSSSVRSIALQGDVPWVAPVEAIDGLPEWDTANTQNHAYLRYRGYDDQGNPLRPPERNSPAITPSAQMSLLQRGIELAHDITGQFSLPGQNSKDTSGIALERRNAQSELSTFNYVDNLSRAKRYEMTVLVDLFPAVVEQDDVIRLMNEDGTEELAQVNPNMEAAYKEPVKNNPQSIKHIINPDVGRYDVAVTVGASYQTKRLEDADRIIDLLQKMPTLAQFAPDLILRQLDFTESDAFVERLKKALPPGAIEEEGEEPIPPQAQQQMQEMDMQNQQMQAQIQEMQMQMQQIQAQNQQLQAKAMQLDIENREAKSLMQISNAEMRLKELQKSAPQEIEKNIEEEGTEMDDLEELAYRLEENAIESNNKINDLMLAIQEGNAALLQAQVALAEAINRPRESKISIVEDPETGEFKGTKVEI